MDTFFTSDFHLNGTNICSKFRKRFKNVNEMNDHIIRTINSQIKDPDKTIIYHLGDFMQFGNDHGVEGFKESADYFVKRINATVVLVKGNHDENNNVKTVGSFISTTFGGFSKVILNHYPSSEIPSNGRGADILLRDIINHNNKGIKDFKLNISKTKTILNIHGHCHAGVQALFMVGKDKRIKFDALRNVLNFNVCCDLNGFMMYSKDTIIKMVRRWFENNGFSF